MALEVRHLKLVDAIAGEGTMTRAGSRLNISQSALSHQLTHLETELGVSLFRRVPRGMRITPAGEALLECARTVLGALERAEEDVRGAGAVVRGTLRISTECYTCYHWLPSRISKFEEAYPGVEIRIAAEQTRRPVEGLLAGELDLAIVSHRPRQSALLVRELFRDELVAILAPHHHLASRTWLKPEDFAKEHLITYSLPIEQLTVYQEFLKPAGVKPRRVSRVDLTEAMIEMVKAGLGIAVLARWAVTRHLSPALLKAVRLGRGGLSRTWYAAALGSKARPRYVDAFVDLLAGQDLGV
jgi:LysR family transcriptional regulator for metE and metH